MFSLKRLVVLFFLALFALAPVTAAAKRRALVIGNDDYTQVLKLQKAANDAAAMESTLDEIGFKVTTAINVTRRDMNFAIQNFVNEIETGDVAMLFFAGHGVEIDGENFLLPTDIPNAKPGQEGFVKGESISLNNILGRLKAKNARVNIVILDACRNNPFESRAGRSIGASRGLARIASPQGTFVMYSADAGEEALDRLSDSDASPNSVFTRTLIPLLKEPGRDLVSTAREARRQVRKLALTVSHQQTPAYYDAVLGEFYFNGRAPTETASSVPTIETDFNLAQTINTEAAWSIFLQKHRDKTNEFHFQMAIEARRKLQIEDADQEQIIGIAPGRETAHPIRKQNACTHRDSILQLSKYILDHRDSLTGSPAKRFGTRAAYLNLRYDEPDRNAAMNMLRPLLRGEVRDSLQLAAAYTIARHGINAGLTLLDKDPQEAFAKLGNFALRALILKDQGKSYVAWVIKTKKAKKYFRKFFDNYMFGLRIPYFISDQSDAFKFEFSKTAESNDELILAAAVLATQTDLDAFQAFMARHSDDKRLHQVLDDRTLTGQGFTALHDTGPTFFSTTYTEAEKNLRRQSYSILRAAFHSGEQDFLNIYVNQSGQMHGGQEIADEYFAQVQGGYLNPSREPELAWIYLYEKMVATSGRTDADNLLGTFNFPNLRHFSGLAKESIDWMIATKALTPYLRNIVTAPKRRPILLARDFDWERWMRIAEPIGTDKLSPKKMQSKQDARIAVELLFVSGRLETLIEFVPNNFDIQDAMTIYQDIMMRLDRRCSAFSVLPGQALMLGGNPAYVFPNEQ